MYVCVCVCVCVCECCDRVEFLRTDSVGIKRFDYELKLLSGMPLERVRRRGGRWLRPPYAGSLFAVLVVLVLVLVFLLLLCKG